MQLLGDQFYFLTRVGGDVYSDSRLTVLFTVESPLLSKNVTYSRLIENTVYVSPRIALNRNASMIHVFIAIHLLSGCA